MMRTPARLALAALALGGAVACQGVPASTTAAPGGGRGDVKIVTSSDMFLAETLTDWVSYSTDIALVTIVGESDHEPNADVKAWGEGHVGRTVTARVDRVLWRAGGPLHAPRELAFNGQGYVVGEAGRQRAVTVGAPRLEPGEQFVMPISFQGGTFGPLSPGSPVMVVDGRAAPLPEQDGAAVRALAGKDANEIARLLEGTPGDASAAKYQHLEPYERVKAVVEDRRRQSEADRRR